MPALPVLWHAANPEVGGSASVPHSMRGAPRANGLRHCETDREHVKDWAEFHASSVSRARESSEATRQKIRELEEYIPVLRAERDEAVYAFEKSIVTPDAVAMIETEPVRQADQKAESAFRSRDRLAATLWRLRMLHNDDEEEGTCSCRDATADCTIWEILEEQMSFLEDWEERQADRLRADKDHALPDEHPLVIRYGRYSRRY
jgi:hypothetical protein